MSDEPDTYWVYNKGLAQHAYEGLGWSLGWFCYGLCRLGFPGVANRLVDRAIMLRRGNPGAVRAVGYLNGVEGRLALKRGRLMIEGRVGPIGPFADKCFFATYDIAARSPDRALHLIRRWEWDAIPETLQIVEGELDSEDLGAEGILWVSNGRAFYVD